MSLQRPLVISSLSLPAQWHSTLLFILLLSHPPACSSLHSTDGEEEEEEIHTVHTQWMWSTGSLFHTHTHTHTNPQATLTVYFSFLQQKNTRMSLRSTQTYAKAQKSPLMPYLGTVAESKLMPYLVMLAKIKLNLRRPPVHSIHSKT